ncbi:unnamed protein product [Enterobius vermicularis]|uniref:AMP-binding domain-containing protein n=1 Tax=Enterobius vermicularis TaxID=51028 RepID=A0A0N4UVE8_ENTVE|nr:unnamed protein product [Enterobius vermicularis]
MAEYSGLPFHIEILKAANSYWDSVAMTAAKSGRQLKYNELYTESYRFATVMKNLGAQKGDIICVILPNCLEYPVIFLGCALIGCSISGISPSVTDYGNYQNCLHFEKVISETEPNYEIDEGFGITLDDTLITPFSSGTTGPPKCVELTHRNYNCATAALRRAVFNELSLMGRRSTLAFLPFYHGSGFWALCFSLLDGHHSIVIESFQPSLVFGCIEKYKVDIINVVPAIVSYMCQNKEDFKKFDLSSVTTVLCGSAPLSRELSEHFLKLYPHVKNLLQGYGMTEIVILSHITPLGYSQNSEDAGSCGKLLPGFQAKAMMFQILDLGSGEEIQKVGEAGELCLKSDSVMKGYYGNPEATSDVIDKDGWLHTGDIVYRNRNDLYFVVDRIKDLIKVNGLQVSPSELESVILSFPGVTDAAVVGIYNAISGQVKFTVLLWHL